MGKISGGPLGQFTGKVGNIVGRVRQGQNILSVYQPNVANPRTINQVNNRTDFSLIASLMSAMLGVVKVGFKKLDGYKRGSAYSSAVGYNSKISGIINRLGSEPIVDLTKVALSEGKVDLPFSPSCEDDSGTVTLMWADNSGLGDAQPTDKVVVACYDKNKKAAYYDTALASRSDRQASFVMPTAWVGDTVDVWIFMVRESTGDCSMTEHVATLSL